MLPKILIGCPTYMGKEYCLKEYLEGVKNLSYTNYELVLVDNSENDIYYNKLKSLGVNVIKLKYVPVAMKRIVESRNILVEYAINNGFDYFFSLEQDVIPPSDAIERLIAHKKEVVTGIYGKPWARANNDKSVIIPLVWDYFSEEEIIAAKRKISIIEQKNPEIAKLLNSSNDVKFLVKELRKPLSLSYIKGKGLIRVKSSGVGCMMIKTDVLKKIKFRENPKGFDDMTFCDDLEKNNIILYADTDVICSHYVKNDEWLSVGKWF